MIEADTLRDLLGLTVNQALLLVAIDEAGGYPEGNDYSWIISSCRGLRLRGLLGDDWDLTDRGRAVAGVLR